MTDGRTDRITNIKRVNKNLNDDCSAVRKSESRDREHDYRCTGCQVPPPATSQVWILEQNDRSNLSSRQAFTSDNDVHDCQLLN